MSLVHCLNRFQGTGPSWNDSGLPQADAALVCSGNLSGSAIPCACELAFSETPVIAFHPRLSMCYAGVSSTSIFILSLLKCNLVGQSYSKILVKLSKCVF